MPLALLTPFSQCDTFKRRHGISGKDKGHVGKIGYPSLEKLMDETVPPQIRLPQNLVLDDALTETEALDKLKGIMSKNKV